RSRGAELYNQVVAASEPVLVGEVSRVAGELVFANRCAKLFKLAVVAGCHDQVAVGSRKYLVGHDVRMCIADPFGHLARHQIVEGLISKNADRRIDKCRIYIATASGALALRQRRKDPDDRIDAGK